MSFPRLPNTITRICVSGDSLPYFNHLYTKTSHSAKPDEIFSAIFYWGFSKRNPEFVNCDCFNGMTNKGILRYVATIVINIERECMLSHISLSYDKVCFSFIFLSFFYYILLSKRFWKNQGNYNSTTLWRTKWLNIMVKSWTFGNLVKRACRFEEATSLSIYTFRISTVQGSSKSVLSAFPD